MSYPCIEQRWFRAAVREHGAIGKYTTQDFHLNVEVTGSHHKLMAEAITIIGEAGYEVHHIVGHSINRETI